MEGNPSLRAPLFVAVLLVIALARPCEGVWCYQCLQTLARIDDVRNVRAGEGWILTSENAGSNCAATGPNHRFNVSCERFEKSFNKCFEMSGDVTVYETYVNNKGQKVQRELILPVVAKGCGNETQTGCVNSDTEFDKMLDKYVDYEPVNKSKRVRIGKGRVCRCTKNWCNTTLGAPVGRSPTFIILIFAVIFSLKVIPRFIHGRICKP